MFDFLEKHKSTLGFAINMLGWAVLFHLVNAPTISWETAVVILSVLLTDVKFD